MSLREFVVHTGLYTLLETDTPSTPRPCTRYPDDISQILASGRSGSLWPVEVEGFTNYRPCVLLPNRIIATSIAPREQSRE
ncbi:hypothetical protein Hanom_Chr07g00597601 [Helianthus anomalus]